MQEMLEDESDAVASLALESLAALCNADALDFYKAWPVVHRVMPNLPQERPLAKVQWVAVLSYGYLDAKAYPDKAGALMQLLWKAAKDHSPEVSQQLLIQLCLPGSWQYIPLLFPYLRLHAAKQITTTKAYLAAC